MNQLILSGHLGDDPKVITVGEQHKKALFSLAVRDGVDKEGNQKTLWFYCEAWDSRAEFVNNHFKKGQRIEIIGKAVPGTFEKNGVIQSSFRVQCQSVDFGGPKTEKEPAGTATPSIVGDGFMNIPDGIEDDGIFNETVFCPNCFTEVKPDGDTCPNCGSTLPIK